MLVISVETDLKNIRARLERAQHWAIPYAAASALTQVAENARMDTVREMRSKLKVPTEWTLRSMWKKPATKTDLTAMVYLKDGGGSRRYTDPRFPAMGKAFVAAGQNTKAIIGHLFSGGTREWKRFEDRMKRAGLLPVGMAAVPGEGARLDANGNIPRAFIVQMLAYFRSLREGSMDDAHRAKFGKKMGKAVGIGGAQVDYFISRGKGQWFGRRSWKHGRAQHLPPGIWQRSQSAYGTSIKPIIMFVPRPSRYKQYFDLPAIVRAAKERDFDRSFHFYFERLVRAKD